MLTTNFPVVWSYAVAVYPQGANHSRTLPKQDQTQSTKRYRLVYRIYLGMRSKTNEFVAADLSPLVRNPLKFCAVCNLRPQTAARRRIPSAPTDNAATLQDRALRHDEQDNSQISHR